MGSYLIMPFLLRHSERKHEQEGSPQGAVRVSSAHRSQRHPGLSSAPALRAQAGVI